MLNIREITLCRVALLLGKPSPEKKALLEKLWDMRRELERREKEQAQ